MSISTLFSPSSTARDDDLMKSLHPRAGEPRRLTPTGLIHLDNFRTNGTTEDFAGKTI